MKNIAIDDVVITLDNTGLKCTTKNGESFNCPLTDDNRKLVEDVTFNKECDLTMQIDDKDFELMRLKYGAREI